jgi:endoplasmic reticulum junction formation protein lunapark
MLHSLYSVRYLLTAWYAYWMNNSQDYLESLYKERDQTIEKLKAATKYDSTQKLLEKYGGGKGSSPKTGPKSKDGGPNGTPKGHSKSKSTSSAGSSPQGQRVFMNPPPTANIQRRSMPPNSPPVTAEFAPNAFDESNRPPPSPVPVASFDQQAQQFQQPVPMASGGGWMDRLVTALMGEDETLPTNRLALLCTNCRLINGLAPPGVRTLEELGKWKCGRCGAWNGVDAVPVPIPGVGEVKSESKTNVAKDDEKMELPKVDDEQAEDEA